MAWIAFNPQGDGLGVDETPTEVVEIFEITTHEWVKLHDRGRATYVDAKAVYAVWPDDEEVEKEANLHLAANRAEREGLEASL